MSTHQIESLGVSTLVFLIIVFLIGKYVWPALKAGMEKRQGEISAALEAAEHARADAASAEEEKAKTVEAARSQGAEIVAQARSTAEQIRSQAASSAQAEYERIVASAGAEVALSRQRAIDEASTNLGSVVMDVVETVISRETDGAAHADLIGQAVNALDASAAEGGIR